MARVFQDREQAGRLLAAHLKSLKLKNIEDGVILALPRGGIPVAYEIARELQLPMEPLIVRKIGHPLQPEYGIGAVAEDGFHWLDPDAVGISEVSGKVLERIIADENEEVSRRISNYRRNQPLPPLTGRTVILVDDGLATGVTARVAARYVKSNGAKKVILAVPVCAERTAELIRNEIDDVVCLTEPASLMSVGQFYLNFRQLSDEEVIEILARTWKGKAPPNPFVGAISRREVILPLDAAIVTQGTLTLPADLKGMVLFAHGSGSSRLSPRNQKVAAALNDQGLGTLLFDLLTTEEAHDRSNVFDVPLLGRRLAAATDWIKDQPFCQDVPIGYFGASTGSAAALWSAAEKKDDIRAVVSRGGRPDLALSRLGEVEAETLLIVGGADTPVIPLNEMVLGQLKKGKLLIIPGAGHLFEEPGALEQVSAHAARWFLDHLPLQREEWEIQKRKTPFLMEQVIEENAHPLRNRLDLIPLIEKVKNSRVVMLGESTHGTHEFYQWRRRISQDLIANHGFRVIAVEGDWPACAEVHRALRAPDGEPVKALNHFQRWPTWMWANKDFAELVQWMKEYNQRADPEEKCSLYGLDVYSLFESMDDALKSLEELDPALARRVKLRYECFDPFQRDERDYMRAIAFFPEGCRDQVVAALHDLLNTRLASLSGEEDLAFDAEQNARIVKNAEHYYRTLILGDEDSWNVRERHMMETLEILADRYGPQKKVIVWAHNTHVGDYRATDMANEGQVNIGGLAREKWGEDQVSLIGFGTYRGEVVASHAWDGPMEVMIVPPGRSESLEAIFHRASHNLKLDAFYLWLKELRSTPLGDVRGHRAIGVVYHPAYERFGNYVPTSLARRYDAFIFIDQTTALVPLFGRFRREEIPETWPRGV